VNISKNQHTYQRHVLFYYNQYATLYDLGEFIRRGTRREAMELSGWIPGDSVLDMCTGTGEIALAFAAQGANVVGTDIARGMLQRAFSKSQYKNSAWSEMDATRLAFSDKSFDISVLSLALHHMPESVQLKVLRELRRVTRKRVILVEPNTPVNPTWIPLWNALAAIIDESEHMNEWFHQDFVGTCRSAGLAVDAVHEKTYRLHQIVICNPSD